MRALAVSLLPALMGLGGCASAPSDGHWGAGARLAPGWEAIGEAALEAAADPFTWAPAAGALALQIGDLDNEIADWANEETPIFGSRETAETASDWLRASAVALYIGAGLAVPAGEDWIADKAGGFAAGAAAGALTSGFTELGKTTVRRRRPSGEDRRSFPSGHTSVTAVSARLTASTLRYSGLGPGWRRAAGGGLAAITAFTGWARVEAAEHHPADILAGAALGNFFAVFTTRAFLEPALGPGARLQLRTGGSGGQAYGLRLSTRF